MADEYEDNILETKQETSNDFALANGDVLSVLKSMKPIGTTSLQTKRRFSFVRSSAAAKYARIGTDGLSVSRPQARTLQFTSPGPDFRSAASTFAFSFASGKNATFGIGTNLPATGQGASNGEDLRLKEQATPVFSGLFANREDKSLFAESKKDKAAVSFAGGITVSADSPANNLLSLGLEPVIPGGLRDGVEPDTEPASAPTSKRTVQRNLTLSAEDMASFRSYQVGYNQGAGDQETSGSTVHYSEKTYNGHLSSSGEYTISEPATGYRPTRPIGEVIVIDDPVPGIGGWIGIPERPIGGWIGIPERPWIIVDPTPYPFVEYDIFEEYGVDLSSDWTEYEDSDFSKIDLAFGAKLSFTVSATNAATFTVYQCIEDENGSCTLKALRTTALVYDAESGNYVATTQALLLEAGQYCLYVQSADPTKEGDAAASYKFELNREDSDIFVDGDNSDDWTDLATEGEFGEVAYAGTLDAYSFSLLSDWVGFGDSIDYAGFTLDSAAKLSFSLDSTDAAKFTIYKLVRDKNGTYSLKALQTTTLSYDKEFEDYEATTKALLLEAGEYYFSMQSTNAAQGGSAYYNIYLNDEDGASEFFTDSDNSDDWTDLKAEGPAGQVRDVGVVDENSFIIREDWVGFGDEFDYAKFTLNDAAKLSFSISAGGAAKFTIYQLIQDKNGKYSLKALQTTTLSYDTDFEDYEATTKALLLNAGEYYFSVQSPDAAQGGSAYYTILLNQDSEEGGSEFFTDGDDSDDWTDLATEGPLGQVRDVGIVDGNSFVIREDWVGFGDAVDYTGFTLDSAAKLSFSIIAGDSVKFTIYQLIRDKNGTYSLKALQTTALSYDKEMLDYEAVTKALLLEAGDYYFSVQSTNAAQGGSADYSVYLNQDPEQGGSEFYTEGNSLDDWTDLATEGAYGSVGYLGSLNEFSFDLVSDWVGFGDTVDYAGFTLDSAAKLSFSISADGAAKFTLYQLVQDKNGKYSLKALQSTSLSFDSEYESYEATTKSLFLAKGDYYFSVQSTNAPQGGGASYWIYLNGEDSHFFAADDSSNSWSDIETLGPDGSVGDLGVLDEYSTELTNGWVGGKESDYARITLFNAAKVSFSIHADDAAKFTVYQLVQDKNGKYSLKALQSTALAVNSQTQEYDATTKALLLEAGEYYVSMQAANASLGVNYGIALNGEGSTFFTEGWNFDDWTDLKTAGECGSVGYIGVIDEFSGELLSDWVGFGDAVDYAGFTLSNAASLRFSIDADDAATFTVCRLVRTKSGMYALEPVQTTALAKDSASGNYEAVTKALLLEAGEYYFCVQSTNAPQGGSAHYTVNVNPSDCTFYTQGENFDDWTDLATEGAYGSVGYIGVIDEYSTDLADGWVGFGDAVDYMGFTLLSNAKLSFSVDADGAASFTIYQLVQNKNGTYSLKTLQSATLGLNKASGDYEAITKGLLLEAGEYYLSMQFLNAAQGGSAGYHIRFNGNAGTFYTEADNSDDWISLSTDGAYGDVGEIGLVDEYSNELVSGWVGFGDAVDYMRFSLFSASNLSFSINATDAATFTIYQLVQNGNGSYKLKTLQTTALSFDKQMQDYEAVTKGLLLDAGEYYFSVQSANAAQGGSAYYNLSVNSDATTFYTEADDSDDWTDVKTQGPYGMVGGIGVIDEYSYELAEGWVGYGDEFDYASFTLFDKADLSFSVEADGAATFTVYSLLEANNGTYKLKVLQTAALVLDRQTQKYTVNTKVLQLEAGEYYFSMQSTNAAQGGSAHYSLCLNDVDSKFYPDETTADENWSELDPIQPTPDYTDDILYEWTCGYPAYSEPVKVEPELCTGTPADDVLACPADIQPVCGEGLAASGLVDDKQADVLKEFSSIA